MTTETGQSPASSSLPYKKFDNDEASEQDTTNSSENIEKGLKQEQHANGLHAPVVEVPLNDNQVQNGGAGYSPQQEVVLHMNGVPDAQAIRAPEVRSPAVRAPEVSNHTPIEQEWNWLNLVLSVCSIFCCTVCGILATVTSVLAYIDHRVNDHEAAKKKRLASYALALTALISGLVCMIIIVAVAVSYDRKSP